MPVTLTDEQVDRIFELAEEADMSCGVSELEERFGDLYYAIHKYMRRNDGPRSTAEADE